MRATRRTSKNWTRARQRNRKATPARTPQDPRRRTLVDENVVVGRNGQAPEGIEPEAQAPRRPVRRPAANRHTLRGELAVPQPRVADRCEQVVLSRSAVEEMVRSRNRSQECPPCPDFSADSDWPTRDEPVQTAAEISRTSAERNVAMAFPLGAQRTWEKQEKQYQVPEARPPPRNVEPRRLARRFDPIGCSNLSRFALRRGASESHARRPAPSRDQMSGSTRSLQHSELALEFLLPRATWLPTDHVASHGRQYKRLTTRSGVAAQHGVCRRHASG